MTDNTTDKGAVALDDTALDAAAGAGGHVKVFDGADGALAIAQPDPAAKKPGRTTFANIVLERG